MGARQLENKSQVDSFDEEYLDSKLGEGDPDDESQNDSPFINV